MLPTIVGLLVIDSTICTSATLFFVLKIDSRASSESWLVSYELTGAERDQKVLQFQSLETDAPNDSATPPFPKTPFKPTPILPLQLIVGVAFPSSQLSEGEAVLKLSWELLLLRTLSHS